MSNPIKKKNTYRLNKFDGGLVTKINPSELLPNQSPDLKNVQFNTVGYIETTTGYRTYNSVEISTAPIDGMAVHKASAGATEYLVVACDGSLYKSSNSAETFVAITGSTGILFLENNVKFTHYKKYLFFSDGISQGYKYGGGEVYQAGVRPLTATTASFLSIVTATTPISAGTQAYGVTGVNADGAEGGFTSIGQYVVGASGVAVNVTGIPTYPVSANVSYRNLYRKTPGTNSYRLVDAIENNTATAYVDILDVTNTYLPATLGPMPKHKFMVEYLGFLFCAGDSDYPTRVYYCEQGNPDNWPAANYLEIGQDDGYPVSGLRIYNGTITVFKNDGYGNGSVYVLQLNGSDPLDWILKKTNSQYSAVSDKAIIENSNMLTFFDKAGVYNFVSNYITDNQQFTDLGIFGVDSIGWPIESTILSISEGDLDNVAAIDHKSKMYLSVPIGGNVNNTMLIYDHSTVSTSGKGVGAWRLCDAMYVNNFIVFKGKLYGGSSYTGEVYELFVDSLYNINGSAINSYYWTPYIYGNKGHEDYTKVWRYAYVGVEMVGDWDMYVSYRIDPANDPYQEAIRLKPEGSLWGGFYYGLDMWGTTAYRKYFRIVLRNAVSKMIQIRFSTSGANEYFKVFDLKLDYNLRGQRGL